MWRPAGCGCGKKNEATRCVRRKNDAPSIFFLKKYIGVMGLRPDFYGGPWIPLRNDGELSQLHRHCCILLVGETVV